MNEQEVTVKSSRDNKNYLDVIDKDPKLVNIYMHTVKQFDIKYQVDVPRKEFYGRNT